MTNTLAQILESFRIQRESNKFKSYSDSLTESIPAVIVGLRTANFIPCYPPVLFNGKELIYPLYSPVSVLCLEMKVIGE